MSRTIHIAPSILSADFTRLGEEIRQAEQAGGTLIHVDVMDGRFVPNITMGPLMVEAALRVTHLPLDVHLMIVEPDRHIEAFAKAGANRITVHAEDNPNLHRTLTFIQSLGCKAGVALNPHSSADTLTEIMPWLDIILVMTVNPGFGGQNFIPETMAKITRLRAMIDAAHRPIDLAVDGGINAETAPIVIQAGANVLVTGSAIFNQQRSIAQNIARLQQAIDQSIK